MVIERSRWARRAVVGQPLLAWPCALLLWGSGGPAALTLAALVLWISTAWCVFGILVPMHRDHSRRCYARSSTEPCSSGS